MLVAGSSSFSGDVRYRGIERMIRSDIKRYGKTRLVLPHSKFCRRKTVSILHESETGAMVWCPNCGDYMIVAGPESTTLGTPLGQVASRLQQHKEDC